MATAAVQAGSRLQSPRVGLTPEDPAAMTSTPDRIESSLLPAAREAIARRDMARAEALFRQHLANAPTDAQGLAEFGAFCQHLGRAASARYLLAKALAQTPAQGAWQTQLGFACLGLQAFAQASAHFEATIAMAPGDTAAHYGLAQCHQYEGRWNEAAGELAIAMAHETNPRDGFPILLQLAKACQRAGDVAAASAHFQRAAQMAPNAPALWYAQANFLCEHGQTDAASALLDRCLQHSPEEPRILLEKARCLRAQGQRAAALAWLDRLERHAPGHAEAWAERGHCLAGSDTSAQRQRAWLSAIEHWLAAGDFASAQALLDTLQHEYPASAAAWVIRGKLEQARQHADAAIVAWRAALAHDASCLEAAACLALALEASNRLDEATDAVHAAIPQIRPGNAQAGAFELQLVRARLARRRKDVHAAREGLDALDAFPADDAQRMHAGFERGKLLDQCGDAAGAMAAFTTANGLALATWQRQHPGPNKAIAGIDYMLGFVRDGGLARWQAIDALPAHRRLAFLVGFPRSGTTLLNQVLDGHPAIHAIEEKPTVQRLLDGVQAMPAGYPHALATLDAYDVAWLRQAYREEAARHGADDGMPLVLDKFPMNAPLAGLIHRVFPHARFVFALRHPCDVVLSCFMQNFTLNNTMANFCTLGDTVAAYTRTMDLWQALRDHLPFQVHTIRYEAVVDDFDGQIRALCDFLDVPWRDDLRAFSDRALARGTIHTPSYEQVSQPIYRQARYRWQRYREFLQPFLPTLAPYIRRFGYSD